ncbi:MAG: DUF4386 domain-containing protein, partial [Bacteroidales bacterium]|nr:DUF4386 domain-containing protein [Bacteroidales bacterium]
LFGLHLLFLGILVLRSKNIHAVWGILLVFAGISYIGIHTIKNFFPEFESQVKTAEMILSMPMAFGEVGFGIWLLIRGGRRRNKQFSKIDKLCYPPLSYCP